VERRVAATLDDLESRLVEAAARAGISGARDELRETLAKLWPRAQGALLGLLDLARLVEPPERLDRFGQDLRFAERARPILELLYATWWRVEARALDKVPAEGPVIVVANHAGYLPWDALVLRHALRRDHPARRELRPLLDDRELSLPVFGALAVRLGGVRATADAAERILRDGNLVGVFPEGSAGARKPWRERYRLQRFGRGGFVKIALRTGARVVPCAIVGSEEATPGIARTGWLADRLGLPILSSSALRFGPAALLPLPSRWTLRFGDPVDLSARGLSPEDAPGVNAAAEEIRAGLQAMLDEDLAARGSVFL
jgi:1-acyl-sn-glycerol-3-phosphate acyltransferase